MGNLVLKKQELKCSERVDNMAAPFQSQLKMPYSDKNVAAPYTMLETFVVFL